MIGNDMIRMRRPAGAGGVGPIADVLIEDDGAGGQVVEGRRVDPLVAVAGEIAEVQSIGDQDEGFHRTHFGPAQAHLEDTVTPAFFSAASSAGRSVFWASIQAVTRLGVALTVARSTPSSWRTVR